MKSKFIVLSMVILLVLAFTGFAYAKTNKDEAKVPQPSTAKSFDDHHNTMIDYMKEKGYEDMANYMESVDQDDMLRMHNSMHGDDNMSRDIRSCH